jgi:hypothetical protein
MATTCFAPIRGKTIRLTELTCGDPVTGNALVVTDAFVTVSMEAEYEEGTEYVQKNANGDLCINERAPDALKRFTVTIDWCRVDPELFAMITGATLEMDGADIVGFRDSEGINESEFALELWTGIANQPNCGTGGLFGYLLLPRMAGGTYGEFTVEDGNTVSFQTVGYTVGGSGWGTGPYNVIGSPAGPLDVAIGATQHRLVRVTEVAPPASACGASVVS